MDDEFERAKQIVKKFGSNKTDSEHLEAILSLWRDGYKAGTEFVLKRLGEKKLKESSTP